MHSVLIVLYELLLAEKTVARERVLGLCAPAGAVDPKQVTQTLNTWIEFGLFQEDAAKDISIHPDVRRDEKNIEQLATLTRRLVLRAENNKHLFATEKAKAADFTRAVCWLLAQDIYSMSFVGWEEVEKMLMQQLPADLLGDDQQNLRFITNRERWAPLKAWTVWFGFAWNGSYPGKVLVVDPTVAIRESLPEVFPRSGSTLTGRELVAALAEAIPVLDGGAYRVEIESRLREQTGPDAWVAPPNNQLSTSLTRALLRLIEEGTLKAVPKADAPEDTRVLLTGRNGAALQHFSHFSYHPKDRRYA
ncbi:hypothetical protein Verru16b_03194 [Lacunisphaera limnophila]|uniref:Uncharacterized protein n=1 Tax=Lacunisphaera limnophila TaxID=1838286 RepID=A0A1D8AYY0_9BACT|nr:protein DpdG [Lacunisphaera limnophila]AOS46098.1 hypothetical protein Verru16b_03194 [Lacunisphaera limnophila]